MTYTDVIDPVKLDSLIRRLRDHGLSPIMFRHVLSGKRPAVVSDLLTDLLASTKSKIVGMNDVERKQFLDSLHPVYRFMVGIEKEELKLPVMTDDDVLEYLSYACMETDRAVAEVIEANRWTGPVFTAYPELIECIDEDGLLSFNNDMTVLPYGIEYKDHLLMYHQFLRKRYTNNFNVDFLNVLFAYGASTQGSNHVRIAIDPHRLCPKGEYMGSVEKDYWFGAHFNLTDLDDLHAVGLTKHIRARPTLYDTFYGELLATEFYWSARNGLKTLQIEEVCGKKQAYDNYYLNRYVHAQRDVENHRLIHFDGAVKVYRPEGYDERIDSQMPNVPRAFGYFKLFRIDGDINISVWANLISLFFRDNELVVEYFDPELYASTFGKQLTQYRETVS